MMTSARDKRIQMTRRDFSSVLVRDQQAVRRDGLDADDEDDDLVEDDDVNGRRNLFPLKNATLGPDVHELPLLLLQ